MNSNIKDVYSLTPEQEGIYAQCFQGADNKTYHFQVLCKVNKDADLEIMKKSVELLSLRHQVLKTAFTVLKSTGAIKQVILENRMPAFSVLTQNEPFSQKILDRIIDEDLERSLDLQKDSLFRVTVVDFVDERFTLIHTHHIILDGWCFPVLIHDLQKYYGELLNGVSLEEITNEINKEISFQTSYAQYVNWIKSQDKDVALKYWQNLLKDCSFAHIFGKQKKNNTKNENIVTFRTHLNDGLSQNIDRFARKNKVSYNTIFECAFSIALQKFSNRNDVVFDKVVSGRSVPIKNIENTLGLFVNTVPVRIKSEENSTFENLIKEIQKQTINTNKYGIVPLAEVYKTCDIDGKSIDALFVFENYYLGELSEVAEEGPLSLKLIFFNEQTEFNLAVAIFKENNGYIVRTSYAKEMYTEREISRFIDGYISILDSSLAETKQIKDFSVLSHEEKEKVLTVFNDTAIDYPKDKCVHELFEEQAARTPDKTAVIFKETKLSYKELNLLVQSYADKLKHLGIHEGDVVAILLERSHKLIAFQLAVLKIGAIFLPLDKRYPEERIRYACSDCNVKLLISDETFNVKFDTTVLDIVDFDATEPQSKAETVNSNNECYIIYTSGSTGSPKGCLLTRRGLLNFCANNNTLATLKKQENCIFACVNSVSFDYFIAESLLPLTNGFSVVVFDDNESTIQKYFTDVAKKNNVNVLMTTPTRLKIYFDGKANADVLKQMCCICTSGEPLTADLLEAMYEKSPEAKVYNPIGPSECSVWDMGGELNREDGIDIHIGKPIANAQIYITDQYLNPVPIGVTGEICIAGDGVGAGYLNRPELTAEKFIDNPFGEGKLYRTGDLAYWREDGNIVFVGRNDFQVKIRGLRIELGEIEKAITAVDGIVSGVVVVRKDKTDRQLICAFYTGEEKSAKEIRAEIGKRLPKYMIPHIFMYLENMPMTTSGKINRNALPELELENITTETEYVAPETQEEKALADAISSILTKNAISMFDNFFAIGGDSIKAIYIVSALEEKGYELRVADIMQSDTLADIAKSMKATSDKAIYNQSEVIGVIPFSPIMRAFLHERNTIPKDFVHFCIIATDCDEATARKAFDALISHHDMLRGSFVANGIEIHSSAENDIYSFKAISIEDTQKAKEYLNDVIIDDDKLVHVVFCETENENLIRIIVHHFLIDLVSWEVLMEDFKTAVNQIKNKEVISLPAKTASFMQWSEELRKYAEAIPEANKEYWKKINEALDHVSSFGANEENEVEKYSFEFDESFTDKLINAANKTYGTRTNEILLTALGQAACKIAGGDVGILVESHGRAELNKPLSVVRTVGWFTACYPVVMNNNNNAADALIHTKETMRRIPKNGIEYLL
ncbi:MAG: amino acid adenylation domain-containing protein, partial [Clostridia bacterium]|nr:amino acid adenylation domain-containing protein [Clostridia bacterium]